MRKFRSARLAAGVGGLLVAASAPAATATPVNFAAGRLFDTESSPQSVAIADLNGDGKPDLATANSDLDDVSVLLGDGNGDFEQATEFAAGDKPVSVAIGDLNGDAKPDLVTANSDSDDVSVLLGDGNGGFGSTASFVAGTAPVSVAIGDLNGDAKPDLAIANSGSDDVSVLLGDGRGGFASAGSFATGDGPVSVALGDLNGDGRPDLVTANFDSNNVSVLVGDGQGEFATAREFGTGLWTPRSVAIGDLNGDTKPDLAVANGGLPGRFISLAGVSVLLGDGGGSFGAASKLAAGRTPSSVVISDLNGDGRPDLAVACGGDTIFSPDAGVSVLPGDGHGGFDAATNFAAGRRPNTVVIGDLNGDARADFAVANSDGVSVLFGDGHGDFATPNFAAGRSPYSLAIGDFNGDARLDVAVANFSSTVAVLLGDGRGGFGTARTFSVGDRPVSVAIGDLNGDARPDLVFGTDSTLVAVLLGDGKGGFGRAKAFRVSIFNTSVAIGDLNGDGKPDVAVGGVGDPSSGVSVLLGDGSAGFEPTFFAPVARPFSVAIADLNGDAKPDLAVANGTADRVSVLLGDGDGGFGPPASFAVGDFPQSIAIADLNGDGKPDLAVANSGSNSVSVLLGDGEGGFGSAAGFAAGSAPVSLAISDLNGDSKPDLATANFGYLFKSGQVSVLLGDGGGGFGPPIGFLAGFGPHAVAIGDLDGDIRPDLAVANWNPTSVEGTMSVLRNTTQIKRADAAPPVTSVSLNPARPDGENGWYVSNVGARVSASDQAGGSGVAETRCVLDPASPPAGFDDLPAGCAYTGAGANITSNGVHTLYAASKDRAGNKETPTSSTVKIDQTAPACTATANPNTLRPPNKKLIPVRVTITLSDADSGPNGFRLLSVTSSEPAGPIDNSKGWTPGTPDTNGQLRAARNQNGPGRTYTLTYTATDNAGNQATCRARVTVP